MMRTQRAGWVKGEPRPSEGPGAPVKRRAVLWSTAGGGAVAHLTLKCLGYNLPGALETRVQMGGLGWW